MRPQLAGHLFRRRRCDLALPSSSAEPLSGETDGPAAPEAGVLVLEAIRRLPRWELDIPRSLIVSDSASVSHVFDSLSSNPLLSLRFLLWLETPGGDQITNSSSPGCLAPAALLNSLVRARAWRPALHAIRSTNCLHKDPATIHSFLHRLCLDPSAIDVVVDALSSLPSLLGYSPSLRTWNAALSTAIRTAQAQTFWCLYKLLTNSGTRGDSVTAGLVIQAFCLEGRFLEAYFLLREVAVDTGVFPAVASINCIVAGFARKGEFSKVSEILHLMIEGGHPPNLFTYEVIIIGLWNNSMGHEAFRVFRDLQSRGYAPGVVIYTTTIDGLCKMGRMINACDLWEEMVQEGIQPDKYAYNIMINGYCRIGALEVAFEVYREMLASGYKECTVSCSTMIAGLCLHGYMEEAILAFEEMPRRGIARDVITYNTMIQGLSRYGDVTGALELYRELMMAGMDPTVSTYTPIIQALCEEGKPGNGVELMMEMEARGLEPLVCTNDYIIAGFCQAGMAVEAVAWFSKMLGNNVRPQEGTCNYLIDCLVSADLVDDAMLTLTAMFGLGYSLKGSTSSLIAFKFCQENFYEACKNLDEILEND